MIRPLSAAIAALTIALAACKAGEPGELTVAVYGESFIEDGIDAAELIDGWAIRFDRFEVEIGPITAARGDEAPELVIETAAVIDLALPTGGAGTALGAAVVPAGAYDRVDYRIGAVEVVGSATRDDATMSFHWIFETPTDYRGCQGTAVIDGGPARLELTVHGDHLFYDDLVSSTPNVAFDRIAAADADGDGDVTRAELEAADIRAEERYQSGNLAAGDLWTFIDHAVATVGHIDGEGHCPIAERL